VLTLALAVRRNRLRVYATRGNEVRSLVTVVETHVSDEPTLSQEVTAPRQVFDHRPCLFPPGGIDVDVLARVIGKPWLAGLGGIVGERVEDPEIQPGAERDIEESLVLRRAVLPMTPARKRLGGHVLAAVDVCSARRFLRDPVLLAVPKLTHRDMRGPEGFQRIDARVAAVARLGQQAQTTPLEYRRRPREMIRDHQARDQHAVVVQEAIADLGWLDSAAGDNREVRERIVAVGLAELAHEARGPVGTVPDLEAVQHHELEGVRLLPVTEDAIKNYFEVTIGGGGAHVVDNEPVGCRARDFQRLASPGADEAENRPIARRDLPREPPGFVDLARQVHRLNRSGLRLCVRNREQRDVDERRFEAIRNWQHVRETRWAGDLMLGPEELLARELRLYPGASRIPAARGEEPHFETEPRSPGDGRAVRLRGVDVLDTLLVVSSGRSLDITPLS